MKEIVVIILPVNLIGVLKLKLNMRAHSNFWKSGIHEKNKD